MGSTNELAKLAANGALRIRPQRFRFRWISAHLTKTHRILTLKPPFRIHRNGEGFSTIPNTSGRASVTQQVVSRIAELDIDRQNPLEIVTDIQFVTHSHAAVKLDGLLADEAGVVTDL